MIRALYRLFYVKHPQIYSKSCAVIQRTAQKLPFVKPYSFSYENDREKELYGNT